LQTNDLAIKTLRCSQSCTKACNTLRYMMTTKENNEEGKRAESTYHME